MILSPITSMTTTAKALPAGKASPLCSPAVSSGLKRGIVAAEVTNTSNSPVYLGNADVSASTGLAVPAGTSRVFPVTADAPKHLCLFAAGAVTVAVTEYFA